MANVPRINLLDPTLASKEVWQALFSLIDKVFHDFGLDAAIRDIQNIRTPLVYVENPHVNGLTYTRDPLSSNLRAMERASLIRLAEYLGLSFSKWDLFSDEALIRLVNVAALFKRSVRGSEMFNSFFTYVFGGLFTVSPLWTQDYVTFYEKTNPIVSTPVYQGGSWYPTTHVKLSFDPSKMNGASTQSVLDLLYEVSSINLVVESIESVISSIMTIHIAIYGSLTAEY